MKKWSKELHDTAYKNKFYLNNTNDKAIKEKFKNCSHFQSFLNDGENDNKENNVEKVAIEVPMERNSSMFKESFLYRIYVKYGKIQFLVSLYI